MPLPFIIGGLAAAAGIAGVGSGISGGLKMKDAKDTMDIAKRKQERAVEKFTKQNDETNKLMDELGKQELTILKSFNRFSNVIEKISGRPDMDDILKNKLKLPQYTAKELKEASIGAATLLGTLGGAAVGTAGGYAAAGAATAAVMTFGAASTGTAISGLSGVAATNATLAAIGGGSLASGGGGMALGASILGGATLGVGLLVGGVIFNAVGGSLSEKADEAYDQASRTEKEVNNIVEYLRELTSAANKFKPALTIIQKEYISRLDRLDYIVNSMRKTQWDEFTSEEKQMTNNLILLVGILYKMCKVELALKNPKNEEKNIVNHKEINNSVYEPKYVMEKIQED